MRNDDREDAGAREPATVAPAQPGDDASLSSERALELFEGTLRFIAERGIAQFSLAAIADYLGTSSRMLIYHLGTRDQLLSRALTARRMRTSAALADPPAADIAEMFQRLFDYYVANSWEMELFFFVSTKAFEDPPAYQDFAHSATDVWLQRLEDAAVRGGLDPTASRPIASFVLAALRGLLLDLSLTGDRPRIDDAVSAFVGSLRSRPSIGEIAGH